MRAVLTRVNHASVTIDGQVCSSIGKGFLILLGVHRDDTEKEASKIADKICGLRIFEDEEDKLNLSIEDVKGEILAVSQFTLLGDVRHGKRPSWIRAERPEEANDMYMRFNEALRAKGIRVEEGVFHAEMLVEIHNDGPVTILLDSKKTF